MKFGDKEHCAWVRKNEQTMMFSQTCEDMPLFSGQDYGPEDKGAFVPNEEHGYKQIEMLGLAVHEAYAEEIGHELERIPDLAPPRRLS